METPLVSVVIPSYGHAAFLEECIASVAAQDHPRIELLIVDDCSPDDSLEVARRALRGHRFERAHLEPLPANGGAHAAINHGIALAQGSHIAILNSDDAYAPGRLSCLLAAMRGAGSEFAFSNVSLVGDEEAGPWFIERPARISLDAVRDPALGFALLRQNLAMSTGNFLFTRGLAARVGEFAALKFCHDWDFLLRCLPHTQPVFVDAPLYRYRLHGRNSFLAYRDLAGVETDAVLRRFFRAVLAGPVANPLCPGPETWPGLFELWLRGAGLEQHYLHAGGGTDPAWRTFDRGSRAPDRALVVSFLRSIAPEHAA